MSEDIHDKFKQRIRNIELERDAEITVTCPHDQQVLSEKLGIPVSIVRLLQSLSVAMVDIPQVPSLHAFFEQWCDFNEYQVFLRHYRDAAHEYPQLVDVLESWPATGPMLPPGHWAIDENGESVPSLKDEYSATYRKWAANNARYEKLRNLQPDQLVKLAAAVKAGEGTLDELVIRLPV